MRFKSFMAACLCLIAALHAGSHPAGAFCGFYVAQADSKLFNKASKVVIARHMDSTVLTMANDYKGDPRQFAMVVPVPTFLERDQIRVIDTPIIERLDRFTGPRLVEYHDSDPCPIRYNYIGQESRSASMKMVGAISHDARLQDYGASLGVTVEAEYNVGEYDIIILSAKESEGLETWLTTSGYNIPEGASQVLGSYIKQDMRFFVAKVDLDRAAAGEDGFAQLRPLQIAYQSPKFMLPIRLGTVNADGPQELFAFIITKTGQVESTNYRTVKLPTGMDLPVFIGQQFGEFYTDMFDKQVQKNGMATVFMEYAWNMSWCDPCAGDPLSTQELEEAGVWWMEGSRQQAYVTRLHVRYTGSTFPEDLQFQETGNTQNFQGRYVMRHPWTSEVNCPEGRAYIAKLEKRLETESQKLAELTGWDIEAIRQRNTMPPGLVVGPYKERVVTIDRSTGQRYQGYPSLTRRAGWAIGGALKWLLLAPFRLVAWYYNLIKLNFPLIFVSLTALGAGIGWLVVIIRRKMAG